MWTHCRRCKRELKTKESRELGYGEVCAVKQKQEDDAHFERIQITIFDVEVVGDEKSGDRTIRDVVT